MINSAGVKTSTCNETGTTTLTFDGKHSTISTVSNGYSWSSPETILDTTTYATQRLAMLEALGAIAPVETVAVYMVDYDVNATDIVMDRIEAILQVNISPIPGNFTILDGILTDLEEVEANAQTLEFE